MRPRGWVSCDNQARPAAADKEESTDLEAKNEEAVKQLPAACTNVPAVQERTTPAAAATSNGREKTKSGLSEAVDDLLEGFGDGEMDELESLFDQIREVRDTAGKYSDEDRRRRATEAALRLAAVLGLGDGDDD